jgi:hypothetical protein
MVMVPLLINLSHVYITHTQWFSILTHCSIHVSMSFLHTHVIYAFPQAYECAYGHICIYTHTYISVFSCVSCNPSCLRRWRGRAIQESHFCVNCAKLSGNAFVFPPWCVYRAIPHTRCVSGHATVLPVCICISKDKYMQYSMNRCAQMQQHLFYTCARPRRSVAVYTHTHTHTLAFINTRSVICIIRQLCTHICLCTYFAAVHVWMCIYAQHLI